MALRIGDLRLSNATFPGGGLALRFSVPPLAPAERDDEYADHTEGERLLDRRDVEELREACDAWLRGEVLR